MAMDQWQAGRSAVTGERGVVAAGHEASAAAGVRALEEGGNAFDALVAAAFASYVTEPGMCGIGGYGRLSAFRAADASLWSVDHYLRAPLGARPDMYEIDEARGLKYYETPWTKGLRAEEGPLASGVPGAVAGLYWTQRRLGRLPWKEVLAPAVELARQCLPADWLLVMQIARNLETVLRYPDAAALLLPEGRLPRGADQSSRAERLPLPGLADALEIVAAEGADGFYRGPVAEATARASQAAGGILTTEDLAAYRPRILREEPRRYRDHDYIACWDQVAYEALNVLANFDLAAMGPDSLAYRHLMAEALAVGFVDNIAHYGDPEFVPDSPVDALADPALGRRRAEMLSLEKALPRPVQAIADLAPGWQGTARLADPEPWPPKLSGTSQVAAADAEGNMCSLITSVSGFFGSYLVVPEYGFVLNNGMGNFDPRPGRPNSIAPGKMPIFAAPPLLALKDGKAVFAAGGCGGYRIETGVLHTFLHWADFGMDLRQALEHPRVHCQGKDTHVDSRIPAAVQEGLAKLGHKVWAQRDDFGLNAFARVSAVAREPDGRLAAVSGPAWAGGAGGC